MEIFQKYMLYKISLYLILKNISSVGYGEHVPAKCVC